MYSRYIYITSSMNWNDSVHILCENEWKVIKKTPHIYILIKKQMSCNQQQLYWV